MKLYRKTTTRVILNGTELPIINWSCQLGAAGNINHFEVTTSIKAMQKAGFDPFSDVKKNFDSKISIYIIQDDKQSLIFTGIVDQLEGIWHTDLIEIRGRDLSAILRDKFQAPSDMQYFNQPISEVVKQIAQQNGLGTGKITSTTQLAGTQYDAYQGQEYAFSDRPRPFWRTLQLFALECGFIMFVTPQGDLYFGKPGTGSNHTFYWKPSQQDAQGGQLPCYELNIIQQSRRCNQFTVNVYATDHNNNNQAAFASTEVNGSGGGGYVYNRHPFGLTPENAQQYADAIAEDIQRKEVTIQAMVEGDSSVNVNDKVRFQASHAGDLFSLNNQDMVISGVTQSFEMAKYEADTSAGFFTHITATGSIQPEDE